MNPEGHTPAHVPQEVHKPTLMTSFASSSNPFLVAKILSESDENARIVKYAVHILSADYVFMNKIHTAVRLGLLLRLIQSVLREFPSIAEDD